MSLLTSIQSAGNSLSVFERAIGTIQTNVSNASVPNYTAQSPALASSNLGVLYNGTVDMRNIYSERAVWDATQNLGMATAQSDNLSLIQAQFDVSGDGGVPGALSKLYSAFSAWATSPTDATARNQVLVAAKQVAQAFNNSSAALQNSARQVESQIGNTIDQINSISSQIADINQQIQNAGGSNPSLQANLYNQIQTMSQYANVAVHVESNGTATVLLNGQIPLVVGGNASALKAVYPSDASATYPTASPDVKISVNNGQDVTAAASAGGQLAGLIQVRNTTIPSLIGNQSQQGSLNQLAQAFADRVNDVLQGGQTSTGTAGAPLFTYNVAGPTSIAASLSIDASVTPAQLPAIQPGPPIVANGIANQLAGIANSSDAADQINGSTFVDFYSRLVSKVGSEAAVASTNKTNQTDQVTQAQNLRSQLSGISLDEQATLLLQYQQAYQATSQFISVVNGLTSYLMNIIQPSS